MNSDDLRNEAMTEVVNAKQMTELVRKASWILSVARQSQIRDRSGPLYEAYRSNKKWRVSLYRFRKAMMICNHLGLSETRMLVHLLSGGRVYFR